LSPPPRVTREPQFAVTASAGVAASDAGTETDLRPRVRRTLAAVAAAAPVLATYAAGPALAATNASRSSSGAARPDCIGPAVKSAAKAAPRSPDVCGLTYDSWQNGYDNQYLHVAGSPPSTSNGGLIDTYKGTGSCAEHGSSDENCAEEWAQLSTGHASQYAYENANSGLCLSDPNSEKSSELDPVQLIQYTCGTYPANRRWIYENSGVFDGVMINDATSEYMCRVATVDEVTTFTYDDLDTGGDYHNGQCVWR
jgi:hypothetical protein